MSKNIIGFQLLEQFAKNLHEMMQRLGSIRVIKNNFMVDVGCLEKGINRLKVSFQKEVVSKLSAKAGSF